MLTRSAVAWFGSVKALAAALGVTPQAVYKWGERVPDLAQLQLEDYSRGALAPDQRLKCVREWDCAVE